MRKLTWYFIGVHIIIYYLCPLQIIEKSVISLYPITRFLDLNNPFFKTEIAISWFVLLNDERKVLSAIIGKSYSRIFFLPYNRRATVCWDPGILLVSMATWHNDFSLLVLGNKENSDSNKVWCLFNHTRDKFGLIFKLFQKTCTIHTYRQATSFHNIPRMMFNSSMI